MGQDIVKIDTHVADAQARLPDHVSRAANLLKLVELFGERFQGLENDLDLLLNQMSISSAVGVQLDIIGTILNLDRISDAEPDDEYRIRLLGVASSLAKSGEPETVIEAYLLITEASVVWLTEYQPATVELDAFVSADDFTAAEDASIFNTMQTIIAGGVQQMLLVALEDYAFIWGDVINVNASGDLPADGDHGFGDVANADANGDITPGAGQGGSFARLLEV